ncbi:class I SAM-dependent methyltransferase [Patescibacteria group bacterium]|nr:class I SAM-dependent methyltransferase [Patescibacteria group bacterium]
MSAKPQILSNITKYQSRNPVKKFLLQNFLNRIGSLVKQHNIIEIIDLGCGEGFVINHLKKTRRAYQFTGADISQTALEQARTLNPNANFRQLNINDLHSLYKEQFDLALCLEVLEHLERPEKVLEEMAKLRCRYFIISVPWEPYFNLLARIAAIFSFRDRVNPMENQHIQHFNPKNLSQLVANHFSIKKLIRQFPWLIVVAEKTV